jgi:hypothetical protein
MVDWDCFDSGEWDRLDEIGAQMPEEKDLVQAAMAGVVSGAIEGTGFKDLVQAFLGPLAVDVGTGLGYVSTVYRIKLGLAMMEKARRMLSDAGIEPRVVVPKIFLPILESGSLEEEPELQQRWAALLASAAQEGGVPPAFAGMLRELTADDARFLDALYDAVSAELSRKPDGPFSHDPEPINLESSVDLSRIYSASTGSERYGPGLTVSLNNLRRLGIIGFSQGIYSDEMPRIEVAHYSPDSVYDIVRAYNKLVSCLESDLRENLYMTLLGFRFVQACRPPSAPVRDGA